MNTYTPKFDLKAFFALKSSIDSIARNKKTPHYKYADLSAIREALAPHLGERWVFQDFVQGDLVVTRLYDLEADDEQFIESCVSILATDLDGQDVGKLITYYRRYNRTVLLDLVTEDNDAANPKRMSKRRSSRRTKNNEEEVY
jgi:hypothetical protein